MLLLIQEYLETVYNRKGLTYRRMYPDLKQVYVVYVEKKAPEYGTIIHGVFDNYDDARDNERIHKDTEYGTSYMIRCNLSAG